MGKRILSLILCLTMIFSLFPTAFADEDTTAEVPAETVEETTAQQNGGNEYPLDETAEPAEPASEQPETDSNEAEPASETEPQAESETQTPVEQSAAESGETAGVGQPAEEDEELPPAGEITAAEAEPAGQIESGEEETAEGAGEENAENEPAAGSDEPERYAVAFQCDPEGTVVTVYDTKDLNENAEPRRIEPGTDGTYLLLPGEYCYDAACEGYESIEKCTFTVDDRPLTISLQLTEAAPKRGVGLRTTQENTVVSYGYCGADYINEGKDVLWTLYSDGLLEISGSGEMGYMSSGAPWGNNKSRIRHVAIDSGVTTIGAYAFSGCGNITSVSIPDTVTDIGDYAFQSCSGLTSLTIPDTVTDIGDYAFQSCSGLTSLTIPGTVTYIANGAFQSCSGLTSVTIPAGVSIIYENAFANCTALTSLSFPSSIRDIDQNAFYNCSALTDVYYDGSEAEWNAVYGAGSPNDAQMHFAREVGTTIVCSGSCGAEGDNVTFTQYLDGRLIISGSGRMQNFSFKSTPTGYSYLDRPWGYNVKTVVISDGVSNIGSYAFYDCSSLNDVTLPESVESIGAYAFVRCISLTEMTLPAGVKSIYQYAFSQCSALTTLTIPDTVTLIQYNAFLNCSALADIYYGGSEAEWNNLYAWYNQYAGSLSATVHCAKESGTTIYSSGRCGAEGDNVTYTLYLDGRLFISGTGEMKNYEVVHTYIGDSWHDKYTTSAPWGMMPYLRSVSVSSGVTVIGAYAFYRCSSLTEMTLPDTVTGIGEDAFLYCSGLTSLTLPEGVTSIGAYAFSGCSGLTSLVIPEGVTVISDGTFSGCSGLTSLVIPEGVTGIGEYAFSRCSGLTSLVIPEGVTVISDGTFYNCNRLTGLMIPEGVTGIGESAFYGCSGLTGLVIPEGVTGIGESAFYGCSGLTSLVIPESVTGIGENAFYDCWRLTSLVIPEGVTVISRGTFYDCASLTSLTLPEGVTDIGEEAFYNCRGLTSLTLPASLSAIGNNAFYRCSGLKDVYYAGSKLSWQNVDAGSLPSDTTVHFAKPSCFYDANGGEGAPPAQDGEPGTVVKIPSVIPERERYDFVGWATTPTAESPEYQPGDSVALDGEITLYAVWTIGRYTITYYANGGSGAPAAQSEYYGTDSTISYTVPTRTGYTFLGWNRDPYSLDPEYRGGDAYTAQEPIILYAVWARVVYTLSYDANGGYGVPEDQIVAAGRYHTVSDVEPSRYYYTFRGWALSPDAGTAQYQAGDQIQAQKAITLYAVWEPDDCYIMYDANGGSGAPEYQVVPYDSMMMISDVVPTREGYDFVGWAFSRTAETASYKPGDVMHITGYSTLYAVWKGVDCTISYDANGGTGAPEPQQAVYGETAFLSDVIPERQHYYFEGWAKTPDASGPEYEVGGDYYVEGSATLYAVWSPSSSIRRSGTCGVQGDNLRWTLFYDGWLIISGQGNMQDYRQRVDDTVTPDAPWNDYASGIRYLLIEEGVTSIGNAAFLFCSSLQSAKLPSTLNRIGSGAFFKLENLTSVNIPAALTDLGNMPFADCSALTTAGGPGSGCNVILEGTVIPHNLFNRCTGLTSVDIPEGVVEIEGYAFSNCENLSHVVIPSTVEEMFQAFSDCSNLTSIGPRGSGSSIELGDIARIPMNAFADMPGLRTVTLPASVIEIALFAFDNCSSLTRIMFYGEPPEIDTLAFSGVNAYAYYPSGKNWQEKDRQNYGGQLTWVSYEVYTVSYDANGGTGAPAKQTKIGSETIQISGVTPVREGFNFLGWAESPTATTASYIAGDRYYAKRDLNLYAVWQVIMHATPVLKSISHEPGGVKLTWSAVDGADKYRVFRRAGGSGSWITLADTTDTYFVDASAHSGVSYSYTVRCVTPDGKVYASDYDTVGLSITFVSTPVIQTIESTSEGIHLTWTKPQGSVRFRIFRKIADSGWLMLEDTNAVSFVDRSVTEGTRYTYSIRCITSDGSSYSSAFDAAGKTITHTKVYATPVIRSLLSMPEGIQLTWSESVGAEKYRVFRKTATTGWTKIRDVSSTSYLDTAVTDGTTYVYTVRCITSDGSAYTSAFDSAGKSVTYSKDLPTPIISSLASTPDGVKLTWNAIAGAAKYRVFRKTSSTGWTKLTDTANPNYVDGTAANGTTYTYTVRCVSADGSTFTSGFDSTGRTITFTTIDTPIISSITGTGDGVKLVWNVPSGAVKYRVFRKTGTTGWTKLADTANASYIDGKAVNGETYTYTVRCINAAGTAYTSGFDSTGKTITFSIVATPEIAIIRNTGDGVQLVWYKCTGAEKYRVFRKTANGGWTKVADTVNTSFIDAKAVSGVTYTYTVRCTNSAGTVYTSGFDSTGKTITCKIIDTPHIQTIENLSGGIKLTWNAPTGAEKYFVFRKTNGGGWQKVAETVNTTFTDAKVSSNTTYTYTVRCVSADGSVYTSKFDAAGMTITRS